MKKRFLLLFLLLGVSLFLTGCGNKESVTGTTSENQNKPSVAKETKVNYGERSIAPSSVEKIQVFLFHATQRCTTCIAIGRLAGETVNERFQSEVKSGKIEFREVNIDQPENKELANKFKASGSALYINTIADGEDNIAQDTKVWQLTTNQDAFKDYLAGKINTILGL